MPVAFYFYCHTILYEKFKVLSTHGQSSGQCEYRPWWERGTIRAYCNYVSHNGGS